MIIFTIIVVLIVFLYFKQNTKDIERYLDYWNNIKGDYSMKEYFKTLHENIEEPMMIVYEEPNMAKDRAIALGDGFSAIKISKEEYVELKQKFVENNKEFIGYNG